MRSLPLDRQQLALWLTALAALASCSPREAVPAGPPRADVLVTLGTGTIAAPDSVAPGWRRVRVEEDGAGHILVVFRLRDSTANIDAAAFLGALDTAAGTPPSAVALGGPEVADTGEVVIHFTPGRYLMGCVRRGADGHRHALTGEAKIVVVAAEPAEEPVVPAPVATQQVGMNEFAFLGPDRWVAGSHMLRVRNDGAQDHQLRIARLRPGSSARDWMNAEDPGDHATAVAGVARLGPGGVAFLPVELPRGTYILHCLVPDPASRRPHVELGMFREIHVGQ